MKQTCYCNCCEEQCKKCSDHKCANCKCPGIVEMVNPEEQWLKDVLKVVAETYETHHHLPTDGFIALVKAKLNSLEKP